ncbi:Phosphatidylinositol 3- and 4-kinase family protein [Aspergillus niger]|uniref:Phosphatidylinositol 3-and 4-kinase family protein n=1 Tax=Aspergillus niger TaxID=5061 RepID=A0A505I1S4_ASPNG|nr:Phosphatidylinositol 3- and 4-kinase family protein [Aspergillus niger]
MTLNITIGPSPHGSDRSSITDEEDSSGVQVSPISDSESHGYNESYEEWAHLTYPDELKPSDSASRPRTSRHPRPHSTIRGPTSTASRRHSARRHVVQERDAYTRRSRRHPSPDSPESADSADEYGGPYGHTAQERRYWSSMPQVPGYARSSSPGQSYVYPTGAGMPHGQFMHPPGFTSPSDQLVRLGHNGQAPQQTAYPHSVYGYGAQLQQPHGPPLPPFFVHEHHPGHHAHQLPTASLGRGDGNNPPQRAMSHMSAHGAPPYGGPPLSPHELVPYGPGGYYPYREPYSMVPGMIPPYFNPYPRVPSPSQVESPDSPAPAPVDTVKDEAIARLEKLIMEERTEREAREAREAARQAAIEQEAAEQAAREELSMKGMEELIRQAFLHIEIIGPHVAEGHYDLIGPNGDIILPQVWETVIEPDWTITMHMWPIPEKPKTPEPAAPPEPVPQEPPPPEVPEAPSEEAVIVLEEPKKKPEPAGSKKSRTKASDPGPLALWMVGGNRLRLNKALKTGKKPKAVYHGISCRVM